MAYKASKEKPLGPKDIVPINSNPPSAMSYKNGRYTKIKDLGEGSFGAVFSACDTQNSDQHVAIKHMNSLPQDQKVAYRELFILRRIKHPSLIILRDAFSPEVNTAARIHFTNNNIIPRIRNIYFVFEIMDYDLKTFFKDINPNLTEEQVAYMLYQILCGLQYLHSRNIIHRDLKTANILVNLASCAVKIADFGLSRTLPTPESAANTPAPTSDVGGINAQGHADLLGPQEEDEEEEEVEDNGNEGTEADTSDIAFPSLTLPEVPITTETAAPPAVPIAPAGGRLKRLGLQAPKMTKHILTRWYRAPEVILLEPYDAAVDIWSIGCIFGEMLGKLPGNKPTFQNRKALFQGAPCGNLSRERHVTEDEQAEYLSNLFEGLKDNKSQLGLIFSIMGSPQEEDLAHLDPATADIFRQAPQRTGLGLERFYPSSSKSKSLELMKNMLEFTPSRRITVQQAMEHPFFTPLKGTGYFPVYAAQAEAAQRSTASTGIELIADSDFMHNITEELLAIN